jgi:hypothetical protein
MQKSQAKSGWPVDLASEEGRLFLGEGWSSQGYGEVRYATRQQATLLLDIGSSGGTLSLELFGPAAQADLWLNKQWLATVELAERAMVEIPVPQGVAADAVDRLEIRFSGASVPVPLIAHPPGGGGWPIGKTGAALADGHSLVVRSAGKDVGDFAEIWVDGVNVINGRRGYNLVALSSAGEVLDQAHFDTLIAAEQSAAMAAWIRQWPAGTTIAGAAMDAVDQFGDGNLSEEVISALQEIGLSTDMRGKHRWSHAFVGAVGAAPDSALEDASLFRPAAVAVGPPVDGFAVTGGIGEIDFRAK